MSICSFGFKDVSIVKLYSGDPRDIPETDGPSAGKATELFSVVLLTSQESWDILRITTTDFFIVEWKGAVLMKRDYLSRLGRAARWYLPPVEAAEVLEDYQELIEREPRSEEALLRDVGRPREAARRLAQAKIYRRWLAVFILLAACMLVPAAMTLDHVYWNPILNLVYEIAPCLGFALSFAWFQRNGNREETLPKGIVPLLAVLLLGMAWVWFWNWVLLAERFDVFSFISPDSGWMVSLTLELDILAAALIGMFALVKARLGDRRWRAVYVWGLTVAVLGVILWGMLNSMTFDPSADWQLPYILRLAFITVIGLVGTGVSIC